VTSVVQVHRAGGRIEIEFRDGRTISLGAQEIVDVAEATLPFLTGGGVALEDRPHRTVRRLGTEFRVVVSPQYRFWDAFEHGEWEPDTLRIFDAFIDPTTVVLDVGAWIGPTTLYAAGRAARVIAFEPDPVAFAELCANVRANGTQQWASTVSARMVAIGAHDGTVVLGNPLQAGDSGSGTFFADSAVQWRAESLTLDTVLAAEDLGEARLFVKMDIEGGEYEIVGRAVQAVDPDRTDLFLSLHPPFLADHLRRGRRGGPFTALRNRLSFAWMHFRLIRSLPWRRLYYSDGRPFRTSWEVLRACVLGRFAHEVLATNRAAWRR
jgi:FkbM family methyltransferase